jgi:hypothetical protein
VVKITLNFAWVRKEAKLFSSLVVIFHFIVHETKIRSFLTTGVKNDGQSHFFTVSILNLKDDACLFLLTEPPR